MTDAPQSRPDPLVVLRSAAPVEPPDPRFVDRLRGRLVAALGHAADVRTPPTPGRDTVTTADTTTMTTRTATSVVAGRMTPYLCVHDAAAALDFYGSAFGAVELMRMVADDGRVGHAELAIGDVHLYLSDEYPDLGVVSPVTLGGTAVTLHLEVADVDALHATVVAAGAESLSEPADQPHGARHGTVRDPYGHRWMLSQSIEDVDVAELARRTEGSGFAVVPGRDTTAVPAGAAPAGTGDHGGIWAAVNAADAPAMIEFLTEVIGFERRLVVPGAEPGVVEHSQLAWPEGGVVQVASAGRHGTVFAARPTGQQSLYVITSDPHAVHERCAAAGVEIVVPPASPDYDTGGMVFTIRDREGNLWSFGSYAGER
jgi:PhnB protein